MTNEEQERMDRLVQRIQEEQNSIKFTQLIRELNELLDRKKKRLDHPGKPNE